MQPFISVVRILGAMLPVAYCGGLVWYFTDLGGLDDPVMSQQLSPTIYGLGFVGLLFAIGLAFQIWRAFKPKDGADGDTPSRPKPSLRDDDSDERPDADAMIARYLAQRDAAASTPVAARPAGASFGRRTSR